jgi:hypothetical protein
MIKMQLILDSNKMLQENAANVAKVQQAVDDYLIDSLHLKKADDGFYYGDGSGKDFSRFGLAFNTLRKKDWFINSVSTWLYFNSDASDDPDDFVIEDMKEFSLNHLAARV